MRAIEACTRSGIATSTAMRTARLPKMQQRRGVQARQGRDRHPALFFCSACKKSFFPQTGTIFEDRKLPLSVCFDFLLQVFSCDSFASMSREERRSDATLPYWMGKLFAVLEGVQEGIMLSDRVWIDETYWPLTAKDAVRKLLWGLSANQMCIGAGVDDSVTSIYLHEGFGKTSKAKTRATFGVRIERGSTLLHDMEDLGLSSEKLQCPSF